MNDIREEIGVYSERVLMRLARAALALSVMFLIPSVAWLIGGILGLLPTAHLSVGDSTGERTLASVAVASCITAAIACWNLEKDTAK